MIQAKTGPGNRAWIRRCSESKPAGLSHFKANQTRACSRQAVGFHSTAPKFRQRNRDNRSQLPRQHYYATHSPLEVNDTRRPYSAPSITPQMLRYADTLCTADSPPNPPRMRLWVPSAGSKSDPAAGIPGPLGNMSIQDNAGPSTPENLSVCGVPARIDDYRGVQQGSCDAAEWHVESACSARLPNQGATSLRVSSCDSREQCGLKASNVA